MRFKAGSTRGRPLALLPQWRGLRGLDQGVPSLDLVEVFVAAGRVHDGVEEAERRRVAAMAKSCEHHPASYAEHWLLIAAPLVHWELRNSRDGRVKDVGFRVDDGDS